MSRGLILGIESSCDETAAAVVERGARTLSSVVASQIATHLRYGGVVPELASREHLRAIVPVVRAALAEAGVTLADLDAIAVTSGPGLAGALLVGITYAKASRLRAGPAADRRESSRRPHPRGAAAGAVFGGTGSVAQIDEAALALVVSGGHTHLYLAEPTDGTWHYSLIGRTLDDAAGEAYDKVAKLLGLGYPGGPWIDALARFGDPHAVPFAFAQIKTKAHLGGKRAAHQGRQDRADRRARSSFSVFFFRNQDRRAALCRAARHARRSCRPRSAHARGRAPAADEG